MNQPTYQLLITGGTIDSEYDIRTYSVSLLPKSVVKPYIDKYIRPDFVVREKVISLVDGRQMTDAIRERILQAIRESKSNNIIITHGTATMVETGQYLKQRIVKRSKIAGQENRAGGGVLSDDFLADGCAV